jgi:hypothetical protein
MTQASLKAKLDVYQQRGTEESKYKYLVLKRVIAKGTVSLEEATQWVLEFVGENFSPTYFRNAFNVIEEYCKGGANLKFPSKH